MQCGLAPMQCAVPIRSYAPILLLWHANMQRRTSAMLFQTQSENLAVRNLCYCLQAILPRPRSSAIDLGHWPEQKLNRHAPQTAHHAVQESVQRPPRHHFQDLHKAGSSTERSQSATSPKLRETWRQWPPLR